MISGLTLGTELRRFQRSKLGRIAILALCLIPLLYSALYLWGFWNPFGKVKDLPIAFVNEDRGTVVSGKPLHAGDEVVEGLKENDQINFDFVSKQEALDGVKEGDYYFVVELTPDFSEAVASPATGEPRRAVINTIYNDANGYLSTMIGENVMRTMLPVISNKIGAQAIDKVLVGVQSAGTGLDQAALGASMLNDGAQQLDEGLDKALTGAQDLSQGAGTLNTKMGELASGADQLADGTATLNAAVGQATGKLTQLTQGVDQLGGGVDHLAAGATQINDGVQQLKSRLDGITTAQASTANDVRRLATQLQGVPNPEVQRAAAQLQQLATQIDTQALGPQAPATLQLRQLASGTQQLAYQLGDSSAPFRGGFDQLRAGTGELPGKIGELTSGVQQLNDGAQQLKEGAHRLQAEGTTPLAEGTLSLVDGISQLDEGAGKLADGTGQLSTKLKEGSQAVPRWTAAQREGTASVLGGPVELTSTNEAGSNTFGGGLAPFFFSLAMFIGGMIIFLLMRPMQNRAVASGVAPLRAALDGLLPGGLIATVQAATIVAVTLYAVGLDARYPFWLYVFSIGVSIMFTALNQMLNVVLGPGPGKVAAMAMLMFMILSSGGLYPVQTEPALFQWLHPINPMTYSVNGFRELMYGNLDHRIWVSSIAIAGFTALFIAITALGARRDRMWTMKRLHPAISL
ncbi:YhgE/Pip domain-containing protein [Corynebacterium sp. 13CS0277]|uniref:YhgE/Pip domain-containing protein n=1 Tax=Corynebacterium sp. 13CS0277 TaxID=2071994 RepID=UPI000D02ED05|nr:YhgE/Pip domain-containing protein [Corynebacterium sp. 13CS0277]PRQ11832.1 YhgE/Pip domain-containing protein [Corynebacterium sp. 13CS0277]